MAELLVHLHVYYHNQIDFFIEKLKNINDVEWDLVVTYSKWNERTARKLRDFKKDVRFMEVENVGYDVWPFIKLIKSINLKDYEYVMKLHTKRAVEWCRPNIIVLKGFGWRNALIDGMLYSKEHFRSVLRSFRHDKKLGMVSSLLTNVTRDYFDEQVQDELNRLGIPKKNKYTCMGTMFMMRTEVLEPLQSDLVNFELFNDGKPRSGLEFQNAHLYERVFSHLAINKDMKSKRVSPIKKDKYIIRFTKVFEPLGKFMFCLEREGFARRKFLRLMGIKIYLDKGKIPMKE